MTQTGLPSTAPPAGGGGQPSTPIGLPSYDPAHPYQIPSHTGPWADQGGALYTEPLNVFGKVVIQPKYYDGMEWAPAADPSYIPTLQDRLVKAGLLKASDVRRGVWDQASATAYKTLLALANVNGGTDHDALNFLLAHPGAAGAGGSGPGGAQIVYTNPADVQAGLRSNAESLTGGDLPASEADAFVQNYHNQEQWAQSQTGDVVKPASVGAAADAYIRQQHPGQVAAYGTMSNMIEFYRMLGVL